METALGIVVGLVIAGGALFFVALRFFSRGRWKP